MFQTNPYAPPAARVADVSDTVAPGSASPPFFAVSILKLALLSVCTFGLYEIYWFYKQWDEIKFRERLDIQPFWRAFFAFIFCYQCFARIRAFDHPALASSRLPAGALAGGWVILSLTGTLPDPYGELSLLSFLFLLPAQRRANEINAAVEPAHDPNARFTPLNVTGVVLGGVLLLAILGLVGTG